MTHVTSPVQAAAEADLSICSREPIHLPGSIQPHGTLLILRDDLTIEGGAANTREFLGHAIEDLLGKPLSHVVGEDDARRVAQEANAGAEPNPVFVFGFEPAHAVPGSPFLNAIAHHHDQRILLEFEPSRGSGRNDVSFRTLYPVIRASISHLEEARSLNELYHTAAEEVRALTGFERVMIYQFDDDWHGWVVGESRLPGVDSYLDHHFPASDIPAQARELYRLNRSRVIVDSSYRPVPLIAAPGARTPVDLSFALLRSVSPVHIEYLRNMGVGGSTSFSICQEGKLWGLIACHHRSRLQVPFEIRTACEFIAQVLAMQIGAQQRRSHDAHRLKLQASQTKLLAAMQPGENLLASLTLAGPQLMHFMAAGGAALYLNKEITLIGATPSQEQVLSLIDFLTHQQELDVAAYDSLPAVMPGADAFKDTACGVLAMRVSKFVNSYILWFRPERVRTITWGGNPNKPAYEDALAAGRIHPRRSFEQWKQIEKDRSIPWRQEEVDAAIDFRTAVVNIVLRAVEELAEVSAELRRANSELEAFSYSVSHDLRAPFRHIAGFSDLLERRASQSLDDTGKHYVRAINEAAKHAGRLVDALLAFAHISRIQLQKTRLNLPQLLADIRREMENDPRAIAATWKVNIALNAQWTQGDPTLLRLVLQNLLNNALKFSRGRPDPTIELSASLGRPRNAADGAPEQLIICVRDNGAGFDNKFAHKLFTPFQRLHRDEEFEGTGIGLANVKRIVERHGGSVWAEGEPDAGAAFYITLPVEENS